MIPALVGIALALITVFATEQPPERVELKVERPNDARWTITISLSIFQLYGNEYHRVGLNILQYTADWNEEGIAVSGEGTQWFGFEDSYWTDYYCEGCNQTAPSRQEYVRRMAVGSLWTPGKGWKTYRLWCDAEADKPGEAECHWSSRTNGLVLLPVVVSGLAPLGQ